jgi:hypothetical protein
MAFLVLNIIQLEIEKVEKKFKPGQPGLNLTLIVAAAFPGNAGKNYWTYPDF